jgi:hypothetical protein
MIIDTAKAITPTTATVNPYFDKESVKQFWSKVEKTDNCWIWKGAKSSGGYGHISRSRAGLVKHFASHRFSWIVSFYEIPEGLDVCHHCDNPSCVRPDHLFLGSVSDNMLDCSNKGRIRFGESHHASKLNDQIVYEIITMSRLGRSQGQIAKTFDVTQSVVWRVLSGRGWAKSVSKALLRINGNKPQEVLA